MSEQADKSGPLHGIRVLELGQLIAGPFCGQLLGDMGAEVVKIEAPGCGDPMRSWGQGDQPTWWRVIARNKYSVAADLKSAEGQDLVRRLSAKADILIENFRPGTLEKWQLDPEDLAKRQSAPDRHPGFRVRPDRTLCRACGFRRNCRGDGRLAQDRRRAGSRARSDGISIGDTLAATYGCMGALAALHNAISGEGKSLTLRFMNRCCR